MKVQCEVETDVWRAARVFSLENGDTMGGVVTSALKLFLQDRVGPKIGAVRGDGKQSRPPSRMRSEPDNPVAEKSRSGIPNEGGNPSSTATLSKLQPTPATTEVVTPMAKCRKCGEPFPVADMITEPKTGRLFCPDCVENMKNNQ